jgi:hypothetical protein
MSEGQPRPGAKGGGDAFGLRQFMTRIEPLSTEAKPTHAA